MSLAAPPSDHAGDDELRDQTERIWAGQCADFGGRAIDASWVRCLVVAPDAFGAVHIKHATIVGQLNLRDVRASAGGACHALILEACTLHPDATPTEPGLDASHAHLARLCLRDCTTTGVELGNAVIAGPVELDGLQGPSRTCWVKARGVRVAGALTAREAKLKLPWAAGMSWPPAEPNWQDPTGPYALDLPGADIGGSLVLWPGFKAAGGVRIAGASIGEGLRAAGAKLEAARIGWSTQALFAQYARIRGPVFLSREREDAPRFRAHGSISLYGADIDGTISFDEARVVVPGGPPAEVAVYMQSVSVSGDVLLMADEVATIELTNATVDGDVFVCNFSGRPIERLDATSCRIRGDLLLRGVISRADFSGSRIDGRVELGHPALPLTLTGVNATAALRLSDAHIGRDLRVQRVQTTHGFALGVDWARGPLRIRTRPLGCYRAEGWQLAEALYAATAGPGLIVLPFLQRGSGRQLEVRPLDGTSAAIYSIPGGPDLATAELAAEYLAFFCAQLWGGQGPFLLTGPVTDVRSSETGGWDAAASIEYDTSRFDATFHIAPDGMVTMTHDAGAGDVPSERLESRLYAQPLRWYAAAELTWPVPPPFEPGTAWDERTGRRLAALRKLLPTKGAPLWHAPGISSGWPEPTVDLSGLRAASLDDGDGRNWFEPEEIPPHVGWFLHGLVRLCRARDAQRLEAIRPYLRLQLAGFEYERVKDDLAAKHRPARTIRLNPTTGDGPGRLPAVLRAVLERGGRAYRALRHPRRTLEDRVKALHARESGRGNADEPKATRLHGRTVWIGAQYATHPPGEQEYRPEPFEQLARVSRTSGNPQEANDVLYAKIKVQGRLQPDPDWSNAHQRWYRTRRFLYRWTVQKAVGTAVVRPGRMFWTFVAVWLIGVLALMAAPDALKVRIAPVIPAVSTSGGQTHLVLPASHVTPAREDVVCGERVSKLVYPLDVMIPFVDLGQESRCEFSLTSQGWGIAAGLYSLLGWLLTAGVVLAFSSVVRRQFER